MIQINLLPLDERPSKWPVDGLLLVAGVLVIMICSSIYSYSLFAVWKIEKQLQNTRNQYQLLQSTQAIMTSVRNKQQLIDKKNDILAALTKERQSWYGMIHHLTLITSPQVFFTEMIKSDRNVINIKGWTASYPLVIEFMHTLENDQLLIESVLTNVEYDVATRATKFEILLKPKGL